jgi:hypothetical protein
MYPLFPISPGPGLQHYYSKIPGQASPMLEATILEKADA